MIEKLYRRAIDFAQLFAILVFIFFEELIWEGIAEPIYRKIHALRILQKIEATLRRIPGWAILVIFVVLLLSVEMLGIYAGVMFVGGHFAWGVTLYLTKIPIAAFTFWMFRVSEEKLMRFGWFRYLYEKLMALIAFVKSLETYRRIMAKARLWKRYLKRRFHLWKARYFGNGGGFVSRMKHLYRSVKKALKRD